jgi:TPR repeat protein
VKSNPAPATKSAPVAREVAARTSDERPASGLVDESTKRHDLSYLLEEDEPPAKPWGRYVVMIVFIAAVAGMAWHWRDNLQSLVAKFSNGQHASTTTTDSASAATAPVEAAPASAGPEKAQPAKPETGNEQPPVTAQPPAPVLQSPTQQADQPAAPTTGQPPDQSAGAPSNPPQPSDNPESAEPAPKQEGTVASVEPPVLPATLPPPSARTLSSSTIQARKNDSFAAAQDSLEAEGEKYLYGNGVPQNCARAQRDLLKAAGRSNMKAQSVLGTMYATGHCVSRDLPTAYHWFARALHADPSNNRIEADLKVLWNQMTPDQRQTALRAER